MSVVFRKRPTPKQRQHENPITAPTNHTITMGKLVEGQTITEPK